MLSIHELVIKIAEIIPNAQALTVAFCYVLGFIFLIISAFGLSRMTSASMYVSQSRWVAPVVTGIVGVILIGLSSTISAFLFTFFDQSEAESASRIFEYAPEMLQAITIEEARETIVALLRIVQFIGLIAFIRGFYLLQQASVKPNSGYVGRAITHIIGGTLAINIVMFVSLIEETFNN